jgi:hypothetical protein
VGKHLLLKNLIASFPPWEVMQIDYEESGKITVEQMLVRPKEIFT